MGRGTVFLLLGLPLLANAFMAEENFCRDLTCTSKDHLLSTVKELRKQIALRDAVLAESNCTACYSSPCLNGGTCKPNGLTGYMCECPDNFTGANCQKEVKCDGKCGRNTDCYIANHQANCICKFGYSGNPLYGCSFSSKKVCMNGDPHYVTFDGARYDYQSTCPYTFSAPCGEKLTGGYDYFRVKAKNELLKPKDTISYVESVQVEMYNQTIYVNQYLQVFVNNIQVHVPYYYPSSSVPKITIILRGREIVVKNGQFVEVAFTPTQLCVTVPDVPAFQGKNTLCGLAGNLDNNCRDDFITPDGTEISLNSCYPTQKKVDDFGDSWRTVEYTNWGPTDACVDGHIMTNTSAKCDLNSAVADCKSIFDAQLGKGVFASCVKMGNETIQRYYDNCLYDVCRYKDKKCDSMVDFVHACQFQIPEVNIAGWREPLQCEISCPLNSHYSPCASACPATCADHTAPDQCDSPCVEGCTCDYGHVLDTTNPLKVTCIRIQQCGCSDNFGNFHAADEHWLTKDCTQDNYCANGTYLTSPHQCSPYGHCVIDNWKYGCQCDKGFKGNGTFCEDINECQLDPTLCGADTGHGTCINTIGSYQCACNNYWTGDNCQKYGPKRHCADLRKYYGFTADGTYTVYPPVSGSAAAAMEKEEGEAKEEEEVEAAAVGNYSVVVYCDMTTDGGGWTLMGNSLTNETAEKSLAEYVAGFGTPATKDTWLGLDLINFYTNYQTMSLRVHLYRCARNGIAGKWTDCTYDNFAVAGAALGYRVNIPKGCHGTEIDYYDGWARWDLSKAGPVFVAYDNDNSTAHCSSTFRNTGWWFDTSYRCGEANLNGVRFSCDSEPVGVDAETYLYWNGAPINKAETYLRPAAYPNYDN